jgi:hypothetical protein
VLWLQIAERIWLMNIADSCLQTFRPRTWMETDTSRGSARTVDSKELVHGRPNLRTLGCPSMYSRAWMNAIFLGIEKSDGKC